MAKTLDDIQKLRESLTEKIGNVLDIAKAIGAEGKFHFLAEKLNHIRNDDFTILVVGEFKRGKSTLINALLGDKILPAKVAPCTGLITEIKYGKEKKAELYKPNQDVPCKTVPPEEVRKYIEIPNDDAGSVLKTDYDRIVLYYPLALCEKNVTIVDSPGLNESDLRTDIVRKYMSRIDAAIVVLGCDQFYTSAERSFFENEIASFLKQHFFVVANRCDELEEEEDKKEIEARAKTYFQTKLPQPWKERFFFCSAKQTLQARQKKHTASDYEKQFQRFEKALESYLSEERGKAKLEVPGMMVRKTLVQIQKDELPRYELLQIKPIEEIEQIKKLLEKPLEELKKEKQKMLHRIELEKINFVESIPEKVSLFCDSLPTRLEEEVGKLSLDNFSFKDIKNLDEFLKKEVAPVLDSRMKEEYCVFIETIQKDWEAGIKYLAERLKKDMQIFHEKMQELRKIIYSDVSEKNMDDSASEISRLLGCLGGLILGGSDQAMEGAKSGIFTVLAKTLPQLGVVTLILAASGLSLGIPLVLGLGLYQSFAGWSGLKETLKKEMVQRYKKKSGEIAQKLSQILPKEISTLYDQISHDLDFALQSLIDDELGKLKKVEEEKRSRIQTYEEKKICIEKMKTQLEEVDKKIEAILLSF